MSLLQVEDLQVSIAGQEVLHGVSFEIVAGESLGLVGESGSGKSMTARAIARLLPRGALATGLVRFDDRSVLDASLSELRVVRDGGIAMIFQDPRTSINPVRTIGDFLTEALRTNRGVAKVEARRRAVEVLDAVRVPRASDRMRAYPHELSGGLLQRVMIAAAILSEPKLILADEPTTALDVTTQAEIMAILAELQVERGLAMLFITHDLELAGATCDRTAVLYAGEIVEVQPSERLLDHPLHPYTAALLAARPSLENEVKRLMAIPGRAASAAERLGGCPFRPRCPLAIERCETHPDLVPHSAGLARCWRADEVSDVG